MVTVEEITEFPLTNNVKSNPIFHVQERQIFRNMLSEDAVRKIIKVAENPEDSVKLPHCTKPGTHGEEYIFESPEWWTSGFFPGSLWALYERSQKRELYISKSKLKELCELWMDRIEAQKDNTDTHDIGFMIMPSFQRKYNLEKDTTAGETIVHAANTLLLRWNEKVGCLKSWNHAITKAYNFSGPTDFPVIIDNMMNLDLLYSATAITGDQKYAEIATKHAETTLKNHIRSDWSSFHLVIYDSVTGARKIGLTCQGYQHESCWSRGQAWALYGFASVYQYTGQHKYLDAAKKLANYFVSKLDNGIVYWDFDAPRPCVWDISAAMIAASGMLLICQLEGSVEYLSSVALILAVAQRNALTDNNGDTILDHSTVNNYEYAFDRIFDTGLVYADYYFLEVGNRLIDMNLV
jgi:Glycosyl Hydrolase Family 88